VIAVRVITVRVTGLTTDTSRCQLSYPICTACMEPLFIYSIPPQIAYISPSYLSSSSLDSFSFQLFFSAFLFSFFFSALPVLVPTRLTKMPNSTSYFLSPDPMSPADGPSIIAFFVLQIIGGNVLIPVMVLASFVRGNKYSRSPIFMNFCIGWIAYSISFMLS